MNSEICELMKECEEFEECESEQSEELLNEIIEQANIKPVIQWVDSVKVSLNQKNDRIKEMTHEELKVMPASQLNNMLMYEWVPDKFVRLYFDFDLKPDELSNLEVPDAISRIFKTIDELSKVFGPNSYGGYTTNEEVADAYDIRYYEQEMKTLSLHVVFYTTKVLRSDLFNLKEQLEHLPEKDKNELVPGVDWSVYKEPGKRQLFRHVMARKEDKEQNYKVIDTCGHIAEGKTPDTQAIAPNGNEKLIADEEIIKAFDFLLQKVPKPKTEPKQKQNEDKKEVKYHNEELERSLIQGLNYIENPGVYIHTTQTGPVTEKLTTWYLLKSFYALSDVVRNEAIELLRNHPRLTEKASTTFDEKLEQVNNELMDAE